MYECWIDGACEPVNPGGTASYGVVAKKDGVTVWSKSAVVGSGPEMSNNVAEYSALLCLLEQILKAKANKKPIVVHGDSMLVVKQMWGTWKMNGGLYIPIALKCRELLQHFPNITGKWIPREQNAEADELSKSALRRAGVVFRIQPEK